MARRLNILNLRQCKFCGHWLKPENLTAHQKKFHPVEFEEDKMLLKDLRERSVPILQEKDDLRSVGNAGSGKTTEGNLDNTVVRCPVCQTSGHLSDLLGHIVSEHGPHQYSSRSVPFYCTICNSKVKLRGLAEHIHKYHSPDQELVEKREGYLKCPLCFEEVRMSSDTSWPQHISSQHSDEIGKNASLTVFCLYCFKGLTLKSYARHYKKNH